MKIKHVIKLTIDAKERDNKKKAREMWLVQYFPITDKDSFMEFEDYYKKLTAIPQQQEAKSDISIKERFDKLKPGAITND